MLDLTEDLIDEDRPTQIDKKKNMKREFSSSRDIPSTDPSNIEDLMMEVAKILAVPIDELREWAKESSLPDELLKAILRIAKCLNLTRS